MVTHNRDEFNQLWDRAARRRKWGCGFAILLFLAAAGAGIYELASTLLARH